MNLPRAQTVPASRFARALGLAAVTLALSLTAACGGDEESAAPQELSATEHNDADVEFASDMIQHHAQAMAMADLTIDRPIDAEVEELAEGIRAAQGPEIETMVDWLTEWDEEIPETINDHVNAGHDHGELSERMDEVDHGDMPGMLTADDLVELEDASDAEFQDLWLELMIEHHAGAVEMAKTQQGDGRYRPAVELAETIASSQAAEIDAMEGLLGS